MGWAVLSVAVAALTGTWHRSPTSGLDPSWQLALHLWSRGATEGREVDFTFGPLGFLATPINGTRVTGALAFAFTLLVRSALVYLLLRLLVRRGQLLVTVGVLWLLLVISQSGGAGEVVELLALALAASRWERGTAPRARQLLADGALIAAAVLIKPGSALVVAFVLGWMDLALAGDLRSRVRAVALAVAGVGVGLVGLWGLSGQPWHLLLPWGRASLELMSGYGAMALEDPGRGYEYRLAIVAVAVCALAWWAGSRERQVWALLFVAGFLFLQLKHGFVRHDGHAVGFFVAALCLLLVAPAAQRNGWWRRVGLARVGALQVGALVLLTVLRAPVSSLPSPYSALRSFGSELATLAQGDRFTRERDAQQAVLRDKLALTAEQVAALAPGAQVEPWDVAVTWAYGVPWRPIPVFQVYSAYTEALDELNAASARGEQAPPRILRSLAYDSIDGRYGLFDSPRYQLEVSCRYRVVTADTAWQVLARGPSRCGEQRLLERATLSQGRAVQIPRPTRPDAAILMRVQVEGSFTGRLRDVLFKPSVNPTLCLDDSCFRFVADTATGPLLLRKANWMPAGPGAGADRSPSMLRFDPALGDVQVEFYQQDPA